MGKTLPWIVYLGYLPGIFFTCPLREDLRELLGMLAVIFALNASYMSVYFGSSSSCILDLCTFLHVCFPYSSIPRMLIEAMSKVK